LLLLALSDGSASANKPFGSAHGACLMIPDVPVDVSAAAAACPHCSTASLISNISMFVAMFELFPRKIGLKSSIRLSPFGGTLIC
jgi:hypothetical protein